ncbi:Protein phosphatase 2C [Leishmania donovani]|uniref:Protein_phosphatase_2C_putative/Pfam:PF00481 n=1 Tax=Leishmania donovani TaxID=5661 RepID=A0A6J8FKQ7_LEIDO|nr:Protein phosphatase 2C [Leishmania donovani]VDZ47169.1 Protein_phosphatase_2C_putative/Pfam:PF00481 [Leishmania donovani]
MSSDIEAKITEAGSAAVDTSAASSPGTTGAHGPGSGHTSLSLLRTDATPSSATLSPLVENPSDATQADAVSLSGRKRRLSFKDRQRQRAGASGSTDLELRAINSRLAHSPMSTASSSSPLTLDLSPARERPLPHSALKRTTAAASPPLTACIFTEMGPSHRGGRAGAPRAPSQTPIALAGPDALTATAAVEEGPSVPDSLVLRATSSNFSFTSKPTGSPHEHSGSLASASQLQSPLSLLPQDTASAAAVPPPHLPSSLMLCTPASSTSGNAAAQINADDTKAPLPKLRTPTAIGSATTSPNGFGSRTTLEELPTLSPVSSTSTSSPRMSFKDRQRAAVASRKPIIAAGASVLARSPPRAVVASSSFTAPSESSLATPSSLPAVSTAQFTPQSPAAALRERAAFSAMTPVTQVPSPLPGYPSLSTSPPSQKLDPVEQVDPTELVSADRDRNTSTEDTSELPATRPPPRLPLAKLTTTESVRPFPLPPATVHPALASHLKRCTSSGPSASASTKPQFRFFAQGCQAEKEEDQSPGATCRGHSGQPRWLRDRSGSAGTASTNPADADVGEKSYVDDEEESLLACTQNEARLHFYDPSIESTPMEFNMASPYARYNMNSSASASRESGIAETRNSTERSETMCEGPGWSQTMPSMLTGESGPDVVKAACLSKPLRCCTRARTESLEAAPQSTGSSTASRLVCAEGPQTSSSTDSRQTNVKFEQHHYSDNAFGTAPLPAVIRKMRARASGSIVGRWRQYQHPHTSQRDAHVTRGLSSTHSTLAPALSDNSVSLSSTQLSCTALPRRRHRSKMLAPDSALIATSSAGRLGGAESSHVFSPSSLGHHRRSHTLDDFALMALASGNRGGATPSSVTPEPLSPSSRPTAALRSTVNARFPLLPTHTAVAASQGVSAGLAGVRSTRDDLPIPLGPIPAGALLLTETSGGSSASGSAEQSFNAGVVSIFSSGASPLPAVHQQASSHANSLGKVSSALASALIAPAPSAEDLSATAPTVNVDTPAGCSSVDELSTHTMRRRSSVVDPGACSSTGGGAVAATANADDAEDSDGDYQQRTVYSYYGGDSIMSATTAELRKLRRRSNYSSLHYGTMTSYYHKRNEQRQGGRAASQHGRRRSGGGRRRRHRAGAGVDGKESTALFSQAAVFARDSASSKPDNANTDDDIETVWEQKGSDEAAASKEEEGRIGEAAAGQWRHHRGNRAKDDAFAAAAAAAAAADDDEDAAQRRTVGMWTSVEHVFLPRYEVVPEAASSTPLTVLASPKSNTNASTSAVTSDPEAKQRHGSSFGSIPDKKKNATPNLTPASDQQPPHPLPPADASPVSIPAGSPSLGAAGSHLMTPAPLTPKGSPSTYPSGNAAGSRPSGLVVLPDADFSVDARASVSLSCSQFRRTPAQASGTMRLEPQDFTFGTVAAEYNMDPADEEGLPQGSCDAKVAARLIFDAAAGVMLMDPEDEVGRYERHGHMPQDDRGSLTAPLEHTEEGSEAKGDHDACDDEANDGACHCDAAFIAKDFKGPDCSRYDANDLYDHCSRCHRRPAAFLCLHCLEAVCPSHVRRHHLQNPSVCTLFLNLLDIMNSFDRIFWCEKCQQFTWKHTEVYDALVDQIAFTRGTYLKHPARDIHCVGYEVRLKDVTASAAVRHASGSAIGAEAHARAHSIDNVPPAAILNQTLSDLWIPAALQNVTSSPATEAFTASEMLPAFANTLQRASNASALPNGGAQLSMGIDAGALGLSPKSPPSGGALVRQRPTTVASNSLSQLPVRSPMQQFLSRDPLDFSAGNTVTVGEPVTKLCALAASVQGWRTTQEDAEAVFLVDIPAISEEVVNRKELREVAAAAAAAEAAAKKPLETLDRGDTHRLDSSLLVHGSYELSASSASESSPEFNPAVRPSDSGAYERPNTGDEEAAATAAGAAKEEAEAVPKETMPMAVFCMFDGHGGDAVAKLAARHFEAHLRRAIEETRPDDVRARALLFFLKAETDSAASAGATAPWLPQSVSAVPAGDGILNYAAPLADSLNTPAGPAASSPPPSLDAASGRMPHSHLSSPFQRPSGSATVSVPFDRFSAKRSEANGDETASPPKTADVPFTLADELRSVSFAGSFSVLVPVTAESLRLHAAGATLGMGDAGMKETSPAFEGATGAVGGKNRHPASTQADTSLTANKRVSNSHSSNRNRKSGVTLDAWEAVEEPLPDMVSVAAGVGSPRTGVLLPRSIAAAEELRHGSGLSHNPNPPAGNVAICPSPAAVVSIPEMEMLRQYFASIMEDALMSLDDYLRSTPEGVRGDYDCVGCTACVVGITANFVLCANVGDSGAAFYTKDRMKVISVKHRVSDEAEQARIHAAGYNIINGRIEGMSAVPRALGDFDFKQCGGRGPRKQAVSAVPDVTIMPVPSDTDQWGIVLACDGVWDTATLHQVHVALTNTVNDLAVSGSAMDAVLRGAELYQNRLRGPSVVAGGSPWSSSPVSPPRAGGPLHSSEALGNSRKTPSPTKGGSFTSRAVTEESMIRYYDDDDDDGAAPRLSQVDAILLTAAAGVFAQCVAPEDNDEGVGLDNCSLIIAERRNVQE